MKRKVLLTLAAMAVTAVAGVATAKAQVGMGDEIPPQWIQIDMSSGFIVNGKVLPAGRYEIEAPVPGTVVFHSAKGNLTIDAPVITRLASSGNAPEDAGRVVFDKVGDKYYASEFWCPDHDGYLIYAAKEAHTHHVVKTQKK